MCKKFSNPLIHLTRVAPWLTIAAMALAQPFAASAEEVMFELDTATFIGQGSGSSRGPSVETFPGGTEFVVDVDATANPSAFMLTFNNIWLPTVVDLANNRRWEFTVLPSDDFTLMYNANTGGINDPIDGSDTIQMQIKSVRISDNFVDGTDVIDLEFTTDPNMLQGCIPGAMQSAEAMPYDSQTDDVVLAAAACLQSGAALSPFWWKLGGQMPLPAPEPGAGLAAAASLMALGGLRRRRGNLS